MDLAKSEQNAVKFEPKEEQQEVKIEEQVFITDQKSKQKPELATVRPLKVEVNDFNFSQAEPTPSVQGLWLR